MGWIFVPDDDPGIVPSPALTVHAANVTAHGSYEAAGTVTLHVQQDNPHSVYASDSDLANHSNSGSAHGSFAASGHAHDAAYVNEGDHTKVTHDALAIDADMVDGQHASAFAGSGHNHDLAYSGVAHAHDVVYVNESDHTKAAHDALAVDAGTLGGQKIITGSVTGPASYALGGFVIDLSATFATSLDFIDVVVETPSTLPQCRFEITRNLPSAGKATVKIMRIRYDRAGLETGTPGSLPAGVAVTAAGGNTASSLDVVGGAGNAQRVNQLYSHAHSIGLSETDTTLTELASATDISTAAFRYMAVGR